MQEALEKSLVVIGENGVAVATVPRLIADAGAAAGFAWEEFFLGKVRNPHTRVAYMRAVQRFLAWSEQRIPDLSKLTPGMVGRYFDELPIAVPSKKLHLAALRAFLDVLVQRHVLVLNPALSVRTERYSVLEGRTPEITVQQAKTLLNSIHLNTVIDLRDRAVIAVLIYTAARAGAVAKLRRKDFVDEGRRHSLHFSEKGGKVRLIPVREDLERYLLEYLAVAVTEDGSPQSPLFRTAGGRRSQMSDRPLSAVDICRMVKRRLQAAGLPTLASPHSFRACVATDLLNQGVALEDVQHLLGHSDSRVTKLYDRRRREVTRNIVERISV